MTGSSSPSAKAQLDKSEREHLEDVVTELRETVEADIKYQLEHNYELDEEEGSEGLFGDEEDTRAELVRAVKREDENKDWEEKFDQYVMGVGYTIINRLTALRCMEVRGFIERPVTQFGDSGTTPAAEKLETEEFLSPEEALIEAYDRECARLSDGIEILFDLDSPYSIIDPDVDTFEEICRKLDEVPNEVWRADDVLGWVYEYYNASKLDELRRKANSDGLEPEDVPPANQFYTPHWVVRMLTDNSLAKMYLESKGELLSTIEDQNHLSPDERKHRDISHSSTSSLANFSTYLVPTEEEEGEAPDFDDPEDIRVIDPACGSGHFLLYAYDVLERIWYRERPGLDRSEVPAKILEYNLFGVDLDLRACQLAAFNLYLKARGRAEEEGATEFEMPEVGIVCADTKIANVEPASEVFDEVAGDQPEIREALEDILHAFEGIHGLGSLLDVRGTLEDQFTMEEQPTLVEAIEGPGSLTKFLDNLHEEVSAHRNGKSFIAQDLQSFLRLLVILSQDYNVCLMNPPYGAQGRIPDAVEKYIEKNYKYGPEFYINFFEVCEQLTMDDGRIGMLIPRSFMFKRSFQDFREDFVGEKGGFDFLAEYGLGILDNATVRTVGTVVQANATQSSSGTFIRLHDPDTQNKEEVFLSEVLAEDSPNRNRIYEVPLEDFSSVPKTPLSYYTSDSLRSLHENSQKLDARAAGIDGDSVCDVKTGLQTGDNDRFIYSHWEVPNFEEYVPFTKGGSEAWIMPRTSLALFWGENGQEIKRQESSVVRNEEYYFKEGLTWTYIKEGGRRFGYFPEGGIFDQKGPMMFSGEKISTWELLTIINSELYHGLFLSLTPDREWNPGDVGRIPWDNRLGGNEEFEKIAKKQYKLFLEEQISEPTSPYYSGPLLAPTKVRDGFVYDHPHANLVENLPDINIEQIDPGDSLKEVAHTLIDREEQRKKRLEDLQERLDELVYEQLELTEDVKKAIKNEIDLRGPKSQNSETTSNSTEDVEKFLRREVKLLLHHFAIESIQESEHGIIPTVQIEDHPDITSKVVGKIKAAYSEFGDSRLVEIDKILGDVSAKIKPYPNIQEFLTEELFEFHTELMNRNPVIWNLITNRLVSDPTRKGFSCYIDYNRMDYNIFDKIETIYIEPIKSELREQRNAAERRRNDQSLSTTEQARAAEEYERCESALAQITALQETALEISSPHPPEWDGSIRTRAGELKSKVKEFRERLITRLNVLDDLTQSMENDQIEDYFSPTFVEKVNENRDQWLKSLEDLEYACEVYTQKEPEDVEAYLYDLFTYIVNNVGSTHYGSNDITFLNYYFNKGDKFLDDGKPREGLEGVARLKAELAAETNEDVKMAKEVKSDCEQLAKSLDSNWDERALQDILMNGYHPKKKYGITINIQPLADKKLVPKIVEDKVL